MAGSNSKLSLSFTVNQKTDYSIAGDLILSVEKRLEFADYKPNVSDSEALISYLNVSQLSVDNNLSIIDHSALLTENRVAEDSDYTIEEDVASVSSYVRDILITDVFVTASNTISNVPLFYRHIISSDHFDPDSHSLTEFKVLDHNLEQITLSEYSLDDTNGVFYNNLESNFSDYDNSFTAYYLQYTVKESASSIKTYTVLLDNQPVFREAELSDIEVSETGAITYSSTAKIYELEGPDLTGAYTFYLFNIDTYAYRYPRSTRLKLLKPTAGGSEDAWYIRVADGLFTKTFNSTVYKYYIPEILTQSFNPFYPYRYSQNEEVLRLNSNLVKLDYDNVYEDAEQGTYVTLLIYDSAGTLLYAPTNNPSLHNSYVGDSTTIKYSCLSEGGYYGIRSIDNRTGFIDIQGIVLKSSWEIRAFYYYSSSDLMVTDINLNPIYNTDLLDYSFVFFLVPSGISASPDQTIYYLKINEGGRVVDSNWSGFDSYDSALLDSGGDYLFYKTLPTWFTTKYGASAGTNFVDTYTTMEGGSGRYFVLGEVQILPNNRLTDVTTIDVRQQGGGLKPSSSHFLNHGSTVLYDNARWDGTPYPSTGGTYVEIPDSVLSGAGGTFSQRQVRKLVEKHIAYGVYPVVRTYGIDPEIISVTPGDGSVTITWSHAEADVYYNIYLGTNRLEEFTLVNSSPQVENAVENSYTINGLINGITYYVYVVGGRYESGTWRGSVKQIVGDNKKGAVTDRAIFFTKFTPGSARISNILSQSFTVV